MDGRMLSSTLFMDGRMNFFGSKLQVFVFQQMIPNYASLSQTFCYLQQMPPQLHDFIETCP